MSAQPEDAGSEAQYMMLDAEREAEEARAAAGYPPPLSAEDLEILCRARLARARERMAAGTGTFTDEIIVAAADNVRRRPQDNEGATP